MLYSHSIDYNKISVFTLFLNKLINGDEKYKTTVDRVLLDAHELASGAKKVYDVDKDKISIIIHLANSPSKDYILSINPANITTTNYRRVLDILQG